MISKRELLAWLDTLPDDAKIGVDEVTFGLQVYGSDAYLPVGNYDPEGVAEGNAFLERLKEAERRRKGNKI